MAWYEQYLGKVCGFIPPLFPGLSRLCCCCRVAVLFPAWLFVQVCFGARPLQGHLLVPKVRLKPQPPFQAAAVSLLHGFSLPVPMEVLEVGAIPAAFISSNGIPVSRNPLTVNEDIGPFLSPCSSGLAAGCCVCLRSPWGCSSGFISVFFLQWDSSAHFASTACSYLLKFKLFFLSAFLPAYQYSLWACLSC